MILSEAEANKTQPVSVSEPTWSRHSVPKTITQPDSTTYTGGFSLDYTNTGDYGGVSGSKLAVLFVRLGRLQQRRPLCRRLFKNVSSSEAFGIDFPATSDFVT